MVLSTPQWGLPRLRFLFFSCCCSLHFSWTRFSAFCRQWLPLSPPFINAELGLTALSLRAPPTKSALAPVQETGNRISAAPLSKGCIAALQRCARIIVHWVPLSWQVMAARDHHLPAMRRIVTTTARALSLACLCSCVAMPKPLNCHACTLCNAMLGSPAIHVGPRKPGHPQADAVSHEELLPRHWRPLPQGIVSLCMSHPEPINCIALPPS